MTRTTTPPRPAPYSTDPHRGWLPWGVLAPLLAMLFVIASLLPSVTLLESVFAFDREGSPTDASGLIAFTLFPFGMLALLVLGWVRYVERRSFASIGLKRGHAGEFLRGHLFGAASILGIVLLGWLLGGFRADGLFSAWSSPTALASILALGVGFALQSSTEELLFRGWLLSVLSRKFNVVAGVLISSGVFTLLHFSRDQHWLTTVSTFLFAVFCALWALRSRSILGVMGWHAGWNWVLAVAFDLPLTGLQVGIPALLVELTPIGPLWLTGGAEGPEGSAICVGYFALAIVLVAYAWRRRARIEAAHGPVAAAASIATAPSP